MRLIDELIAMGYRVCLYETETDGRIRVTKNGIGYSLKFKKNDRFARAEALEKLVRHVVSKKS